MIAALPFASALLLGMVICLEIGYRMGVRRVASGPPGGTISFSTVDGAIFGLYGLLLAFTFSGAPVRFDARRHLIAEETNAIGTAYLRLDLLPAETQPALRELFREYLTSRLEITRKPDSSEIQAERAMCAKLQTDIWTQAIAATRLPKAHADASRLLLPALNAMIDITTTRTMATKIHPPRIIFGLLFLLALVCSVLVGYGMGGSKRRSWIHVGAFVVISVISVYVILDIEYPRSGLIRLDAYDQVLIELRESMK